MQILVTGCGGFLGRAVVRKLLARGDAVRGFGRSDYPQLREAGVELVRGDISDTESVQAACRGVDGVIHCAAIAGVWGPWDRYFRINTLGTQNIIAGCRAHGVGRLVHCSSPSVTFDGSPQSGIDESAPYPQKFLCHYSHTKALAEQAALAAHAPGTLHTAALRPHLIWGADDSHLFPRLIDRARRGRLVIVGDGNNRIDTVHVDNAAAAHVQALDCLGEPSPPAGGRAFFITQDEPVACWQWIGRILEIAGVDPPRRRIGFAAAWRIGAALEFLYTLGRITAEPPMTRFLAAQLATDHYFDITAAKTLLGYRAEVTTEAGIESLQRAWQETPAIPK